MLQSMKKKPKLNIYGNNYNTKDGTCVRDYIHVTDLADIHIKGIKYLKENKKSYLEIGIENGYTFANINIEEKIGVDPDQKIESSSVIKNTSDEFFKENQTNILM